MEVVAQRILRENLNRSPFPVARTATKFGRFGKRRSKMGVFFVFVFFMF